MSFLLSQRRKIFDRSNFRNETWYYFFAWIFSQSTINFFFNKSFVTLHHPHRQSRQSVVGNFSSIRGTMVRRLTRRESEWEENVAREGRHRCRENTRRVWRPRGDTFFSKGGGLTICRQCLWNEEGRAEMRVTDLNIGRERERERKREDRRGRPRL